MRHFAYLVTINSTDKSKNIKSSEPFAVVDGVRALKPEKEKELRKSYGIAPNQLIRLEKIYDLEHFLMSDGDALCGSKKVTRLRLTPSPFQRMKGFVNCKDCLKKLEGK